MLQGNAESISALISSVPPPFYLVYMVAAGFGLPVRAACAALQPASMLALCTDSKICLPYGAKAPLPEHSCS